MKKMLVGVVAALSTLAVAGCGSATDLTASQSPVTLTRANFAAALSDATGQAKSVHLDLTMSGEGHTMVSSADEAMSGTSMKGLEADMTMKLLGKGTMQLRVVDGIAYLKGAPMMSMGSSAKPWIKIDLTSTNNPLGSMFSKLTDNLDPSKFGDVFRSISTLTKVGPETIDTTATTHYKVTVDTSKLATILGVPTGGATAQLPKTITYDVWVDSHNRPVQTSVAFQGVSMRMQFSHWGEPVHVTAPPASQVAPFHL